MTFMPSEAEEKRGHREMRWVSLEGKPSSEKMTSEDACLIHVQGIVAGKLLTCGICRFAIQTPFNLVKFAPELDSGEKSLGTYESAKYVHEWLELGVDIEKFMKLFKGLFMGVKYERLGF